MRRGVGLPNLDRLQLLACTAKRRILEVERVDQGTPNAENLAAKDR